MPGSACAPSCWEVAPLRNTIGRERKNWYGFALLGWHPARGRTGVKHTCVRLIEASSRASTFEALRRGFQARTLSDIRGTSWPAMPCVMLGNPEPGLRETAAERVVLPRQIIGEPPSELVDDAPARRGRRATSGGTRVDRHRRLPRSDGGATVAPPSGAQVGPGCGHPRRRPATGLEHLAAKALVRVRAGQEGLKRRHPARTPVAGATTVPASVLTSGELANPATAGDLVDRRRA